MKHFQYWVSFVPSWWEKDFLECLSVVSTRFLFVPTWMTCDSKVELTSFPCLDDCPVKKEREIEFLKFACANLKLARYTLANQHHFSISALANCNSIERNSYKFN